MLPHHQAHANMVTPSPEPMDTTSSSEDAASNSLDGSDLTMEDSLEEKIIHTTSNTNSNSSDSDSDPNGKRKELMAEALQQQWETLANDNNNNKEQHTSSILHRPKAARQQQLPPEEEEDDSSLRAVYWRANTSNKPFYARNDEFALPIPSEVELPHHKALQIWEAHARDLVQSINNRHSTAQQST